MLNTKVNYPKITLAAARVNAGYSQKEAASRLKINERTLQNYESCANVPDWDMVHKIGELYDFPIDFIFFGSELRLKRDKANN